MSETITEKKENLFVTVTIKNSPPLNPEMPDENVQHIDVTIDEKHDEKGEMIEILIHRSRGKKNKQATTA